MIRPRSLILGVFLATLAPLAAFAQQGGFLDQAGQPLDTSLPIEVAAEALEVRQEERMAVFTGNVDATQGELRLQADEVQIHYQAGEGSGSDVTRLNANGEVHVSSPRETARGDWAIYDVASETVTMGGNVVLTQGPNVIEGDQLIINLATGRSRIEGGASMVREADDGEEGDTRVRGLFTIPDDSEPPSPEEVEADVSE